MHVRFAAALVMSLIGCAAAHARQVPQTPEITYQGMLTQSGSPYSGTADFEFEFFDSPTGGSFAGLYVVNGVTVINGVFSSTIQLNPTLTLNGQQRWMEIRVRTPAGSANPLFQLTPRQKITTAPYAAYALSAGLSGTYADAVTFSNASNLFTGSHSGSGAGLTALNATSLASGTIAPARLSGSYNIAVTGNAANVTGVVAITNGGTGASSAATARTNLGAAAASHSHAATEIVSGNFNVAQMPVGGVWPLTSRLQFNSSTLVVNPTDSTVTIGSTSTLGLAPLWVVPHNPVTFGTFISEGSVVIGPHSLSEGILSLDNNSIQAGSEVIIGSGPQPDDLHINEFGGRVGIGTVNPLGVLHVASSTGTALQVLENTSISGDARLRINSGGLQSIEFRDNGDAIADAHVGIGFGSDDLAISVGSGTRMTIANVTGDVGIGTTAPEARLHVQDGSAGTVTADPFSAAVLERNGNAYLSILSPSASSRGIVFGEPSSAVAGSIIYNGTSNADGLDFRTNGNLVRMAINDVGNIGIGTVGSSIDAVLHVESDSARVIKVDRHGSDGELLSWARDDTSIGSVTVTAGVVAYGAFTGVHYARLDENIPVGTLVSLNGDNDTLGERDDGEVVYGVIASPRANDPAVLGVYIGSLDGEGYGHPRDIAQIAALGNGDMWVIDTGEPIAPGDNLIASGTPGCAMKDDESKFPIGNVIARAAARVDWTGIEPDASGRKRARISVLFSNFVRTAPTSGPQRNVASSEQDIEIAALKQELDELRAAFARIQESSQP